MQEGFSCNAENLTLSHDSIFEEITCFMEVRGNVFRMCSNFSLSYAISNYKIKIVPWKTCIHISNSSKAELIKSNLLTNTNPNKVNIKINN